MSFIFIIKILNLKNDKILKVFLVLALIARIILVFIDVYAFRLPDAGYDDDGFYKSAKQSYISGEKFDFNVYGSYFTYVLYLLMHFIGSERLGVQFINVVFSMISLFAMLNILDKIKVDKKYKRIIMFLMCFMPYLMFSNSILRRDTLISTLIILSLNYFIKWLCDKKTSYCLISCLYVFFASLLHIAVIFTFALYFIFYFLYNHKTQKVKFTGIGYIKTIILLGVILIFGKFFLTNFNTKLSTVETADDIYSHINTTWGNSIYLSNVKIKTLSQLIMWAPVKFIYFILSPMPWMWRNILDIATFLMDSCIYIYLIVNYFKSKNKHSSSKCLFLCFLIIGIVFSIGTFTSGAAVRHRYNILPFIIVAYAIEKSDFKREKEIN